MGNILYTSSVVRSTREEKRHGGLRKIDWDSKTVVSSVDRVFPWQFCSRNENLRGGIRGWRFLVLSGEDVVAANYDALVFYDKELQRVKKVVTHPSVADIHGISFDGKSMKVTSTVNDLCAIVGEQMNYSLLPLMENSQVVSAVQPWLSSNDLVTRVFDPYKEYRAEWTGDVVHFNYIKTLKSGAVVALFCALNLLVQLEPSVDVLWCPGQTGHEELIAPHDLIELTNGDLLICSSSKATVYRFDMGDRKLEPVWRRPDTAGVDRWLRGLDVVGDSVFVGDNRGKIFEVSLSSGKLISEMQAFEEWDNYTHAIFGLAHTRGQHIRGI